jgi:hypothetical protein
MAASTLTTTTFSNDTDPHFRTWVAAFIAAIIAGGWTQTGDTGQINTATVLAPTLTNTSQGYALFSSNDAGGALHNYIIKLEFGSGATSALRPSVWVTGGWATDGAGNLVSTSFPVSTRTQIAFGAAPSGASNNINFSSGSGYFCLAFLTSSAESLMVSVERTRDRNLAFQDQILIIGTSSAGAFGGGAIVQVFDRVNTYANVNMAQNAIYPPIANTPIAGLAALGLIFGASPGNTSPSINVFGVETNSIGNAQDSVLVSILGVNHTYKIQGLGVAFSGIGTTSLMTRYE